VIESTAWRKAALWVAVIFVLGAALGGVVGYIFARHSVSAATTTAPQSEPERRARRVEQLTRELSLSNDQRQQLDTVLSQLHSQYKGIHEQTDAQLNEARQRCRNQIRAILTPEQEPKFEEFLKRIDEEKKRNPNPQTFR
jgi:Spy/CpxP family protein refolding chaperone